MAEIYGWIMPSGKFKEAKPWGHLKAITGEPEMRNVVPRIDEIQADLDALEKDCQSLIDQGEHPEWHRYECAESSALFEVRNLLLDAGFIRVGSNYNDLCFEGTGVALANHMQRCKDLADQHGMKATFERQLV